MPTTTGPLPPLYAAWMTEILGAPLPNETRATCDDCAMCNHVAPEASSFNPETKCCTYLPMLASFLVGQVLADTDPALETGRASVQARIDSGIAVTPLGLGVPTSWTLLYNHGGARAFGESVAMRCPHYIEEGGRCGVWRHRNSVCATWFCKHVRGEVGFTFWASVRELLSTLERELARWCIAELGIGAAAIAPDPSAIGAAELDGRMDPAAAAASWGPAYSRGGEWGPWNGRATEFYLACAELVSRLDFAAVEALCGPELRLRIEVVRANWAKLMTQEPPARLRLSQLVLLRTTRTTQRVNGYSTLDPVEMPRAVFDALHHFDGRPVDEVRSAIVADGGPRLSKGLVRKLSDFGVLVAAEAVETPAAKSDD
jgi:hypothetical protein